GGLEGTGDDPVALGSAERDGGRVEVDADQLLAGEPGPREAVEEEAVAAADVEHVARHAGDETPVAPDLPPLEPRLGAKGEPRPPLGRVGHGVGRVLVRVDAVEVVFGGTGVEIPGATRGADDAAEFVAHREILVIEAPAVLLPGRRVSEGAATGDEAELRAPGDRPVDPALSHRGRRRSRRPSRAAGGWDPGGTSSRARRGSVRTRRTGARAASHSSRSRPGAGAARGAGRRARPDAGDARGGSGSGAGRTSS